MAEDLETGQVEDVAPAGVKAARKRRNGWEAAPQADADVQVVEAVGEAVIEDVVKPPESPYDRPGRWYVVHTYAGYENKVKSNLESRILLDEHGGPHLRGRHPHGGRCRA